MSTLSLFIFFHTFHIQYLYWEYTQSKTVSDAIFWLSSVVTDTVLIVRLCPKCVWECVWCTVHVGLELIFWLRPWVAEAKTLRCCAACQMWMMVWTGSQSFRFTLSFMKMLRTDYVCEYRHMLENKIPERDVHVYPLTNSLRAFLF